MESANNFPKIETTLSEMIAFQRRWKSISMAAYATTTVGIIVCSASASVLAATGANSIPAAILAAATTVLAGIEKSFMFREKWRLHLTTLAALHAIKLEMETLPMDPTRAVDLLREIGARYSADLPILQRE